MKSELEKCLAGDQFNTSDPEIQAMIHRARKFTKEYNNTISNEGAKRRELLSGLFGQIGSNVNIDTPFYCDYGEHIR